MNAGRGFACCSQAMAPSLRVDLSPVDMRDAGGIEPAIAAFARGSNGGMIVLPGSLTITHRAQIIALAARHRLPTVYPFRYYAAAGGLISYGPDAVDQYRLAANYAVNLFVVGMALRYRAMAALAKGATMGAFGLWVVGITGWHAWHGTLPQAVTMGAVGSAALVANAASFGLLWKHREGDANMRSAWICTRNDVLGNLAVLLAAVGVFGTGTGWPDLIVAGIMAGLALQGAAVVVRQAWGELRHARPVTVAAE
jgi:hypothetical protein